LKKKKKLAIWPLPGGQKNYFKATLECLKFFSEGEKTFGDGEQWFIDFFPSVKRVKAAEGYLHVLVGQLGLIKKNFGDKLTLTKKGKEILKTKNKETLYNILDSNIIGFPEIIQILKEKPYREKDIFPIVKEKLGTNWTKGNQVNYRVGWLLSLDKIKKIGRKYTSV